jgi:hypothetical protein
MNELDPKNLTTEAPRYRENLKIKTLPVCYRSPFVRLRQMRQAHGFLCASVPLWFEAGFSLIIGKSQLCKPRQNARVDMDQAPRPADPLTGEHP